MEFSISRLGFFSKKAGYSGKIHHILVFVPIFNKLYWNFPSYLILTFVDLLRRGLPLCILSIYPAQ
jgi:hypothetical protein